MAAYNEVFKRIEKKYRVAPAQRQAVEGFLARELAPDAFGRTMITSVYWDTPQMALISRSLEKPCYKEKLRVRAYGEAAGEALVRTCAAGAPQPQDASCLVFFGIKKKFKGVVYKRRVGLSLGALFAFLGGMPYAEAVALHPSNNDEANLAAQSPLNCQIARELAAMLKRYPNLTPSVAIRCHRVAWAPIAQLAPAAVPLANPPASDEGPYSQLRVTFDDTLKFWDFRAHTGGTAGQWRPIVNGATAIMELKNAGPLPVEFASLLAKHDIFPTSFSKYGTAYQLTVYERGDAPGLECVFGREARGERVGIAPRATLPGAAAASGADAQRRAAGAVSRGSGAQPVAPLSPAPSYAAAGAPSRLRRLASVRFPFKKKGARCA